jgi:hypothetical protein
MNHRELVLSARKKAKFGFLGLPEDVQDEVIEGLDGQTLTLEGARDFLGERGYVLSHEAIAAYYRAVRRERRIHDATQEMTRVVEQFGDQPLEENVRCLTNFLIATAVRQLADGQVGIKDVDLGKVLQAIAAMDKTRNAPSPPPSPAGGEGETGAGGTPAGVLDAAAVKSLRERLGL